jgi:hypothetical protein
MLAEIQAWVWVVVAIAAVLFLLLLLRPARTASGRPVIVRRGRPRRRRWIV